MNGFGSGLVSLEQEEPALSIGEIRSCVVRTFLPLLFHRLV